MSDKPEQVTDQEVDASHHDMIRCPQKHLMKVIDTRKIMIGSTYTVYRRRRCEKCGFKHSTAEVPLGLAHEVFLDE